MGKSPSETETPPETNTKESSIPLEFTSRVFTSPQTYRSPWGRIGSAHGLQCRSRVVLAGLKGAAYRFLLSDN